MSARLRARFGCVKQKTKKRRGRRKRKASEKRRMMKRKPRWCQDRECDDSTLFKCPECELSFCPHCPDCSNCVQCGQNIHCQKVYTCDLCGDKLCLSCQESNPHTRNCVTCKSPSHEWEGCTECGQPMCVACNEKWGKCVNCLRDTTANVEDETLIQEYQRQFTD